MLMWLAILMTATISALFGFGGVAKGTTGMAPVLYFIFIGVFVASLIWGLAPYHHRRKIPPA
jgi:uncharacterized membrane protein YtjA (UPF0391 family)